MDWWENPTIDMLPLLKRGDKLIVKTTDTTGLMACMRLNQLSPPFDNPAIRRALLKGVSQTDFMIAVSGTDPAMRHVPTGIFCPGTPMASDVGLEVFTGPRDYDGAKKELEAAGYKGEKVVVLAPTDLAGPEGRGRCRRRHDAEDRPERGLPGDGLGHGGAAPRQVRTRSTRAAGTCSIPSGPASTRRTRSATCSCAATARRAMLGWPTAPKLEELRTQWIAAPDLAAQKKIAVEMQRQALIDLPYVPLGQTFAPTCFANDISGVLNGFVIFWNVKKV